MDGFQVDEELERTVNIKFPKSVTKNGSLYLSVFALPALGEVRMSGNGWWQNAISHPHASYSLTSLTQYAVPEAETFNLLGDQKERDSSGGGKEKKKVDRSNPVTHLRSRILLSTMTEQVTMEPRQVPGEIAHTMQLTKDRKTYLPILYIDELSMRQRELVKVNATDDVGEVKVVYRPISFGKLRLFLQFSSALTSMQGMGFTEKDTDEVKGIFADTNLVLLIITFSVSAVHLLFDCLAFKSDINFWRGKKSMEGLSRKTILWRAFSQSVIFLYLMDEETSHHILLLDGHQFRGGLYSGGKHGRAGLYSDEVSLLGSLPSLSGRRHLQPCLHPSQVLVLLDNPDNCEWGLCLWFPLHAAAALPQLQAEVRCPPSLARFHVQGIQHFHRRPLCVHHHNAHRASRGVLQGRHRVPGLPLPEVPLPRGPNQAGPEWLHDGGGGGLQCQH